MIIILGNRRDEVKEKVGQRGHLVRYKSFCGLSSKVLGKTFLSHAPSSFVVMRRAMA